MTRAEYSCMASYNAVLPFEMDYNQDLFCVLYLFMGFHEKLNEPRILEIDFWDFCIYGKPNYKCE